MSNTLAELHQECERIGRSVTDAHLPLKMYGKNCEVSLKLCGENGNYWVELRSSIDYDEKVAIILQMFEDGRNDSIAMDVANRIKKDVIDKACKWMGEEAIHGWIEDEEVDKFIGLFRKAMEE